MIKRITSGNISLGEVARFIIGILITIAIGISFFFFKNPLYLPILFFIVLFLLMIFIHPNTGLYLLIITTLFSAYSVEFAGVTIRFDQAMTSLITPVILIKILGGKKRFYQSPIDLLIILYLLINFISSIVNSPMQRISLQRVLMLAVTFSSYLVIINSVDERKVLRRGIAIFLIVSNLSIIYGNISALFLMMGINLGGALRTSEGILYAKGTLMEGNIFGSTSMAVALILLIFILSPHFKKWRFILILGFINCSLGVIFSNTRAVWVAYPFGIISYLLFISRREVLERLSLTFKVFLYTLFFILGFSILISNITSLREFMIQSGYFERITKVLDFGEGTGYERVYKSIVALEAWKHHPIIGNGTDSSKFIFRGILKNEAYCWIGNPFFQSLMDTGIVGFLLFTLIIVRFFLKMFKTMRRLKPGFSKTYIEGFLTAFIGLMVAYQTTSAFWLALPWIFMGISMSIVKISEWEGEVEEPQKFSPAIERHRYIGSASSPFPVRIYRHSNLSGSKY